MSPDKLQVELACNPNHRGHEPRPLPCLLRRSGPIASWTAPSPLQTHCSMLRTCATAFWVATWVFHRPQPPSKRHLHLVHGQGPITTWADAFQRERAVSSAQRRGTELRITRKCLPTAFHTHNVSISRCHLASWGQRGQYTAHVVFCPYRSAQDTSEHTVATFIGWFWKSYPNPQFSQKKVG